MSVIEIVVAFMVLGVIVAPLSTSVIIGLSSTERAAQRTTDTSDQQVLASYFSHDVQSADDVQTASTCGAGTGSSVVQLHWVDPVGAVDKVAAYRATTGGELLRVYCEGGSVVKTITVVHALDTAPTVTCDGAACPASAGVPREVAMSVTTVGDKGPGPSYDTYQFELSATRRVTA